MNARRVIVSIIATITILAALPAAAFAGPYDWPGQCEPNPTGNKQAFRIYSGNDWTGSTDYECGNFWQNHTTHGVYDRHFGTSEYGTIEGMNDKTRSLVGMNKSKNNGACITLFWDKNLKGGTWPYNQRFSFWVPPRSNGMKYFFVRVTGLPPQFSSGMDRRPSNPDFDSAQECAQNTRFAHWPMDNVEYGYGYKTDAGYVVHISD